MQRSVTVCAFAIFLGSMAELKFGPTVVASAQAAQPVLKDFEMQDGVLRTHPHRRGPRSGR